MRAGEVTVAVATCGRPDGLARCLEAIVRGSVLPDELLVVDQAPTAEARQLTAQVDAVPTHYFEQRRLGLSASRNLALANSTGAVIAVTDDDCVADPGWLEGLMAALERDPEPAAVTGAIKPLGPRRPGTYPVSLREGADVVDYRGRVLPWMVGSGANFAARRDVLVAHGGWDTRLGVGSPGRAAEDSDLLYRLLRGGGLVRFDPAAVVRHDWQSRAKRLSTRWSYGFGIGAMCGLCLRKSDFYALRMLSNFGRHHARALVDAVVRWNGDLLSQHARALCSLGPGLAYGLGAAGHPGPVV